MSVLFLGIFMKIFKPNFYFKNIFSVTAEFCKHNGIKALLLDADNTLCIYHTDFAVDGVLCWMEKMQNEGIKLYILSNSKPKRLKRFANNINLPYFYMSLKPLPFKILIAIKKLGFKRKDVALVGDQYFTDILGGKLAGIKTIWLDYIQIEESKSFKFKRKIENKLKKKLKRSDV